MSGLAHTKPNWENYDKLTTDRIPADVLAEDAEMWCERCGHRHGIVWFAPSDLWNAVMREDDRGKPDEFGFCCPLCFMQLADERLGPMIFEVRQEVFDAADDDGVPAPAGPEAVDGDGARLGLGRQRRDGGGRDAWLS